MDAYTGFAEVYDLFMDNIPYEEWADYIAGILQEHGIRDGLVLDLGCGTGKLTRLLQDRGYDMIGVDASGEMLGFAMEKNRDGRILYLQQDMRSFELYGTVGAVVSICDAVNYLTEYEDLVQVFTLVNNYLDPGGVFIFDMNTPYKYRELLGERTIAENREEGSFIWENDYDEESRINAYALSLFIPEKEDDGGVWYRKYEEVHEQKAYSLEEIQCALKEAGMEFLACYDAFTRSLPGKESERVYFIAREKGKQSI